MASGRGFKKFLKKNKNLIWKCALVLFLIAPLVCYILFTLVRAL